MNEESTVPEETDFENEFNKLAESKILGSDEVLDEIDEETLPEKLDEVITDNDGESVEGEVIPEDTDIYAGMDDTAKAHFEGVQRENERLNHQISSDNGRVRAYQRQTQELQGKIQELNDAGDGPSTADIAEAMKGGSEAWSKFAEDYPEIAEVIDQRATETGVAIQEAVDQALTPIKEQYDAISQRESEVANSEASKPVDEEFPDWTTHTNTNEFKNWMSQQPPGIQDLAESDQSSDALALLGLYDSNLTANGLSSIRKSTPDTGVEDAVNQQKMEAEKLKAKRKQQLEDGTTVASRGAKVNPGDETIDDFEAAFNWHAKKKERQRA